MKGEVYCEFNLVLLICRLKLNWLESIVGFVGSENELLSFSFCRLCMFLNIILTGVNLAAMHCHVDMDFLSMNAWLLELLLGTNFSLQLIYYYVDLAE